MSFDEAVQPTADEPTPEVRAWQAAKIRDGLKQANEGRFASAEQVRKIVQKYVPNG